MSQEQYVFRNSFGQKLEIASRFMGNALNQRFRDSGLPVTLEQWAIINLLSVEEGLTQNQLAQFEGKDHTSISRLIDQLIKKEFVKRVPDAKDRRTNLIYLTDKGRELQDESAEYVRLHNRRAFKGLTDEEINQAISLFDKIIGNLK